MVNESWGLISAVTTSTRRNMTPPSSKDSAGEQANVASVILGEAGKRQT